MDEEQKENARPTIAILRVGEQAKDIAYETGAAELCEASGAEVRRVQIPGGSTREQLLDIVREINGDEVIHGCLLFRIRKEG